MGRIVCVGLGPGDPDLMSVKADRTIRAARHVAYFRKAGRSGQARGIVEGMLAPGVVEHAMEYPVTTEIHFDDPRYKAMLAAFYDEWTARLAELAQAGEEVVVLCEGDPFFYGSFMHLHVRLRGKVPVEVVPGITGMSGCWTATGEPITWGDDILTVLPGTLGEDELARRAEDADAIVIMKTGRNMDRIRRALERAGRLEDAFLVERGTMKGERVCRLTEAGDAASPYFSIVLVPGQGRRP